LILSEKRRSGEIFLASPFFIASTDRSGRENYRRSADERKGPETRRSSVPSPQEQPQKDGRRQTDVKVEIKEIVEG